MLITFENYDYNINKSKIRKVLFGTSRNSVKLFWSVITKHYL